MRKSSCSHAHMHEPKNKATGLKERNILLSQLRKEEEEKKIKEKKTIFPQRRGINKAITELCFLD